MERILRRVMRRVDGEDGLAMITAVIVSFIVVSFSTVLVQLSLHNSESSALDRGRVAAVNAAEAGIDVVYRQMEGATSPAMMPCGTNAVSADLTTTPVEHYSVTVQYYATYPPSGTPMTCLTGGGISATPGGAVITSLGTAPGATRIGPATRTMQSEVRLSPITLAGSFPGAVYGLNGVDMTNTVTVNGQQGQGNNGDVYTGGQWSCSNTGTVYGSVYAASVSQSGTCTVQQDVWANGTVNGNGLIVGHDATSSTSSITLSGTSHITHHATSGTTCSGCATRVGPSGCTDCITTNHISPAPPLPAFPVITVADYTNNAPWSSNIHAFSDCTSAGNYIPTAVASTSALPTLVRITPACNLNYNNKVTISLGADLAVVTDGSISMTNKVAFVSVDGKIHTLYLIVPSTSPQNCGNMSFNNAVADSNVQLFIYTPCDVKWTNGTGLIGQIFGGTVEVNNSFSMSYLPLPQSGKTTTTGYRVDIAYIREITSS